MMTSMVGALWLLGEDTIDRYVSDPLVRRHPRAFGIKMVRASLNPPASLANILRGRFPWWRDYEHPNDSESLMVKQFERAMDAEPEGHVDLYPHYRSLSLGTNNGQCLDCRSTAAGAGLELGGRAAISGCDCRCKSAARGQSWVVFECRGSLTTANFGVRSGYSGERFAAKVSQATESNP